MILLRTTATAVSLGLVACTPALNWREVRPADSDLVALFPCKPKRLSRPVVLAGAPVQMNLVTCGANETTYGLGYALLADPNQVTPALGEMRRAAAANIGARDAVASPWSLRGMTANPLAEKLAVEGRSADDKPVHEQAAFFVRGLRIYQATIVGPQIDTEAAETFFSGLKFVS